MFLNENILGRNLERERTSENGDTVEFREREGGGGVNMDTSAIVFFLVFIYFLTFLTLTSEYFICFNQRGHDFGDTWQKIMWNYGGID